MNREHNQFSKKVPKDAEACNIQVASCDFLTETFVAFVRLSKPVLLEDLERSLKAPVLMLLELIPLVPKRVLQLGELVPQIFLDRSEIHGNLHIYWLRSVDSQEDFINPGLLENPMLKLMVI